MTHAEAESAILSRFSDVLSEHQIACLVYFALADTEWKFGCLSDAVKKRAVELLRGGGDVKYWEEESPSDAMARSRTLAALAARLANPQPALKHVKLKALKPPRKQIGEPIGTVFGLPLPSGNTAILQFVGSRPVGNLGEAVFRVLPWVGSGIPPVALLEPMAGRAVLVSGHHEFSILMDGRKKPTAYLVKTDVVLESTSPLDESRHVAIGIGVLPQEVQDALTS